MRKFATMSLDMNAVGASFDRVLTLVAAVLCVVGLGHSDAALSAQKKKLAVTPRVQKQIILPLPTDLASVPTVASNITALSVAEDKIFVFAKGQTFGFTVPFKPVRKVQAKRFGLITDQKRFELGGSVAPTIIGAFSTGLHRIATIDGTSLMIQSIETEKFTRLAQHSLVWDLLRPAKDRHGEPTQIETAALRKDFARAFAATSEKKLSGMAILDSSPTKASHFLVATHLKGYPLVDMTCTTDEATRCQLDRACFVEGAGDLMPEDIRGVGYDAQSKTVFVGDGKLNAIRTFAYHSCFHIAAKQIYLLPAELSPITTVHVDADHRVWIGTERADDYKNASLFFWERKVFNR